VIRNLQFLFHAEIIEKRTQTKSVELPGISADDQSGSIDTMYSQFDHVAQAKSPRRILTKDDHAHHKRVIRQFSGMSAQGLSKG
jgi:hypothetical protein